MSPKYLLSLLICFHLCLLSSSQLTFPSSSIQLLDSGITFYFEYNTTNGSILMGLEMNQNVNYFAIGFAGKGNFEMQTFDIVAFVFSPSTAKSNATVKVLDMYSTQNAKPPTDVSLGGTSDYHLIDSYVADGKTQVLFERLMNTQDKYDYQFVPEITAEEVVINYAFNTGQPGLSYHGNNADTLSSPIYNGFNGVAKVYYPDFMNPHLAMAIHGWILLFGWGILIEITLQFGRYRKFSNVYLKVHLYTASFLYFLTAVASALAIYIKWGSKYKGLLHLSHFYMGLINLGLCTLQTIFGFVFRAIILKRNTTKLIPIFSQSHTISGILIYFINKILIGTGVALKWPQYMPYMYGYYAVLIVFRVAQEILFRVDRKIDGKSTLKIEGDDSQAESNRKLMELLNNNTPVSEILDNKEVKDIKWAILDDKVFSLEEITHPGGNFIFEQINGREVGRFIYGSYGLESLTQSTQYLHSKAAILAVQNNLIGTIQNTQQILVAKAQQPQMESLNIEEAEITKKLIDPKATSVSEGFSSGLNEGNGDWVLTKKTDLTPLIAKFELRSDDYDINPLAKNIRHIGRHVKVSHCSQKKVRLYTLVLSQTESRTRRRQLLWDRQYKDSNINVNPASVSRSDTFPLILKKYNSPVSKTLSSIFHESQIGTEGFIIEGPFGTGLDLTPESTGVHVILAAGTGILPFIDLFDYLLEGVLDPSSGNNIFKNGFKLHLLASFNELGDFVGLDICEKLAKACADKGMKDAFKMVIKAEGAQSSELYSVTKEMFDNAFIEKNVDKECARVYVCGPPVFNQQLPLGLELIGVPKTRIMMV